jgi:glycosyltransferase involved in cell wall biosynthesis
MNILQVVPYFPPAYAFGGPVRVAYSISKELAKRGHNVTVYTTDAENPSERLKVTPVMGVDGIDVHYMRNLSLIPIRASNLFFPPEVAFISKSELMKFDVIHLHEFTTFQNVVISYYARKIGIPYVLQPHGSIAVSERKRRKMLFNILFGRNIIRHAAQLIALTETEKAIFRCFGVSDDKIRIIPNGIDLSDYCSLPPEGSFKRTFKIRDYEKIILYQGRIHQTKGIDLLIKAFAYMINVRKCRNIKLVIAGPDDGYLSSIKSLVYSSNISESVVFTGFIETKMKTAALVDASVFVTPSFYGFPMTFLEACAVGTPIITTTLGDKLEWINDNVGYVIEPNYEKLAKTIEMILTNVDLRKKLSQNCKKVASSNFSSDTFVDKIEQLYSQSINSHFIQKRK